jgi:hypothetical protein
MIRMAFVGLHVECSYVGARGDFGPIPLVMGAPLWTETLASAGTTAVPVPDTGRDMVLRISAAADAFVAIGSAPNAATNPRRFVRAGQTLDFIGRANDKVAWVAA